MNIEELKRLALAANAMPPNENKWTDSEFRRYVLAFEQITTPSLVLELIRQLEHHKADSEVNIRLLAEARKNDVHCMDWLADCRIAVDDNGKRMLPEFVEYLKALKQQRDELLAALKEAQEQKPVAWINLNKWTPSNGPRCVTHEEYEKERELLTKLTAVYAAPVPAVAAPAVTTQADCRACVNRGRINGLSQESYCDSCVYEGRGWRQNHFVDASKMVDTAKRRCEACAILPCSCK